MEEKYKKRDLNFEILRIFSIFLIILHHYALKGGLDAELDTFSINKLISNFIVIGGKVGVNLFVLISGYFLINSKFSMKKIIQIVLQVLFYSVICGILAYFLDLKDAKWVIKSFFPISYRIYWFATAYVGLYLLSPFINKLLNSITKKQHKYLLLILLIMLSLTHSILLSSEPYMNDIAWVIFVYMIAAYIKKYDIIEPKRNCYKFIAIFGYIIMFLIGALCTYLAQKIQIAEEGIHYYTSMNSIICLITSIAIFMCFKNIKISDKYNKVICFFSSASFGVYLFHDSAIREFLWKNILKTPYFYWANAGSLILHIILSAIIIYILGTIIETARKKIMNGRIFKIRRIDNFIKKIDENLKIE